MASPQPRFTAVGRRVIGCHLDKPHFNQLVEGPSWRIGRDPGLFACDVVLVGFYYEPDVGVPPGLDVVGHIFLRDNQGKLIAQLYRPVWYRHYEATWYKDSAGPPIRFETAAQHELIVALIAPGVSDQIYLYEHNQVELHLRARTRMQFSPQVIQYPGSEFLVQIQLIGKLRGDPEYNGTFSMALDVAGQKLGKVELT